MWTILSTFLPLIHPLSKDDITPSPPPVPNMLLCILRKLFQLSTARMTSAPLAPSPPSAGCSQGVAQSARRGREGERKKIQASRSLFRAVPAFSTGSGKGAGPLFCGVWMSRNDGGGAQSRRLFMANFLVMPNLQS